MVRVAGVNIKEDKQVVYSLTSVFGIGLTTSKKILAVCKIDESRKVSSLSDEEIEKIRKIISSDYQVEGDLRMMLSQNIKRLKEVNCYRGLRHTRGLPVRGQRTKTNARTKRGKKITVGSGKKAPAQKT